MKKTLFTLALCAASFIGTASASIELNDAQHYLLVTGEESMNTIHEWYEEHPADYVETILLKDATLTMDDFMLPAKTMYYSFSDATLQFDNLGQIDYSFQMPQLTVGNTLQFPPTSGDLTVSLTDGAMKGMLVGKDLSVKAEQSLLHTTFFSEIDDSQAFFVLHDAEGKAINQGDIYTYIDESGATHDYTNRGIIYDAGDLKKNEIALLFTGNYDPVGFGLGSFSVVALGENYIPVPEPTTGSLSLLALAGLCARRRRK